MPESNVTARRTHNVYALFLSGSLASCLKQTVNCSRAKRFKKA